MTDRNVQYPTRYRMTKVAGTDDIYEMEPVPGEVTDEGTIINKAALLKDTTAALFGFTAEQISDAVTDDVLAILSKAILNGDDGYTDVNGIAVPQVKIATGSYVGTGTYGSSNPCSLTFDFSPKIFLVCGTTKATGNYINYVTGFVIRSYNVMTFCGTHTCGVNKSSIDYQGTCSVSWKTNGISYYSTAGQEYQMNTSGNSYFWVAIG